MAAEPRCHTRRRGSLPTGYCGLWARAGCDGIGVPHLRCTWRSSGTAESASRNTHEESQDDGVKGKNGAKTGANAHERANGGYAKPTRPSITSYEAEAAQCRAATPLFRLPVSAHRIGHFLPTLAPPDTSPPLTSNGDACKHPYRRAPSGIGAERCRCGGSPAWPCCE